MSDIPLPRITLTPVEFRRLQEILEAPAAAPSPALLEATRRYREKISEGTLVADDDTEETRAWAMRSFARLQSGAAIAPDSDDPEAHVNAEGYDADLELARHLVLDVDNPTTWALDTLAAKDPDA